MNPQLRLRQPIHLGRRRVLVDDTMKMPELRWSHGWQERCSELVLNGRVVGFDRVVTHSQSSRIQRCWVQDSVLVPGRPMVPDGEVGISRL